MIEIITTSLLIKEIKRKFGKEKALEIIDFFEKLKENPQKGKTLGNVGEIVIKELKFNSHRFYFITNGFKLKLLSKGELTNIIIKFIRMSKKNNQQKVIEEIKETLRKLGFERF